MAGESGESGDPAVWCRTAREEERKESVGKSTTARKDEWPANKPSSILSGLRVGECGGEWLR